MKNINSILSGLSRTSLLKRTARKSPHGSLKRAVTDTFIATAIGKNKHPPRTLQQGPLDAVGGLAWQAYQIYCQQSFDANNSLQKANAQRAYMLATYAQRNAQEPKVGAQTIEQNKIESPTGQSRYIPSKPGASLAKEPLTYSPETLSQKHFEQVLQDEGKNSGQMLILRAMITAAYADGHLDEYERQQIFQQVEKFELNSEDKASLFDELRNPLSISELVAKTPDYQTAIEVYVASILAIDEQLPAAKGYLQQLATLLELPKSLVSAIQAQAQYKN